MDQFNQIQIQKLLNIQQKPMKQIFRKQLIDQQQPNLTAIQQQLQEGYSQSNSFKPTRVLSSNRIQRSLKGRSKINHTQQSLKADNLLGQESAINFIAQKSPNTFSKRHRTKSQTQQRTKRKSELKNTILARRVNNLKQLFCNKIKRNIQQSPAIDYRCEDQLQQASLLNHRGIQLKELQDKFISLVSIYNNISSIFIFTLSMAFPQIKMSLTINIIQFIGLLLFSIEIALNFTIIRFSLGKKLETIKQIGQNYLKDRFGIDCINIFAILIYVLTKDQLAGYFRMVIFLKLPDCIQKLERLQVFFIENYYNEQYWSLIKVFIFNFCFAHLLAVALIAMTNINDQNWLTNKNLLNAPWYERYIWAYYWGTTIMLTIGFGDLTPVCYKEALCMVFIETISCIVLAYNINCVGSLIANIRSQDIEKSKNMKIFKKLADKHKIEQGLSSKINNYIEQNANIKKKFNIEQQAHFISKLPKTFRTDYLKQANKTIFKDLFFFNHLIKKTLFSLAEKIQMKVTHPEELIYNNQNSLDLFILKNGEVGYISKKPNRRYNKHIFNRKKITQSDSPFLLNTNFITKDNSDYGIKSIVYSVLYHLQYDKLISILKETSMDFELYCQDRDRNRSKIDQFQVINCQFCYKQNHTKFSCPKLHYMPLKQHTINKQLFKEKNYRNKRIEAFSRIQRQKSSSLSVYLQNKEIYDDKRQQATILRQKIANKQMNPAIAWRKLTLIQQRSFPKSSQISFEALSQLQLKFLENTSGMIKAQINKAMAQCKVQDQLWLINLDKMKNYKGYFPDKNSLNLRAISDVEARLKRLAKMTLKLYDSSHCI